MNANVDDPDIGDNYDFAITGEVHLSVQIDNGVLTLTPELDWFGDEALTFTVTDTAGANDEKQVTIYVGNINRPPTITLQDVLNYEEDLSYTLDMNDYIDDPDVGDSFDCDISGNSDIIVNEGDNCVYSISAPADWNGEEVLTFTVSDTANATDIKEITVKFKSINDPPSWTLPTSFTSDEDQTETINLQNYVSDADIGDVYTFAVSGNQHIDAQIDGSGILSINPESDWYGTETLTLTVTDTAGDWDTMNVDFIIESVNDAPVLNLPASLTFDEDATAIINLNDYLSDPDPNDTFSWSVTGQQNLNPQIDNGILTLTPAENWNGEEQLTFTVTDAANASDTEDLLFIFASVNDAPVWDLPDWFSIEENTPDTLDLGDYVIDVDTGDSFVFDVTDEAHLTVQINGSTLILTPELNWSGKDTLLFSVTDTAGVSDNKNVVYLVGDVNIPPILTLPDSIVSEEDVAITINLSDYVEDPDAGDTHTWQVSDGENLNGQIDESNVLTVTPTEDWNGREALTITVTDTYNDKDSADVWFIFTPVCDAPTLNLQTSF